MTGEYDPGMSQALHNAIIEQKWEVAEGMVDLNKPRSLTARLNAAGETALHVAIKQEAGKRFVTMLVNHELMPSGALLLQDMYGNTPLHVAAEYAKDEAITSLLLRKNEQPMTICNYVGACPIHVAAARKERIVVKHLLLIAKQQRFEADLLREATGARLVHNLVESRFYDLAVELVNFNPGLAFHEDRCPILEPLAKDPLAFPSAKKMGLWEYYYSTSFGAIFRAKQVQERRKDLNVCHRSAVELVECTCSSMKKLLWVDDPKARSTLEESFLLAAENGIVEIVKIILEYYPDIITCSRKYYNYEHTAFHLAVINRHEEVWKILYSRIRGKNTSFLSIYDDKGRNILHYVGDQGHQHRHDRHGVILQMQRELQWYETVKSLLRPQDINTEDLNNKTPMEIFNKEHAGMAKEELKWMTAMATACSVVASLVVTIAFAAAIKVPGGNNCSNGLPVFFNNKSFLVFAVSDALALFSSIATILSFLAIFTTSFGIYDYFYSLPNQLIFGLLFLFLSIVSLIIAFSSALFLVFAKQNKMTLIPVTLCAFATILMYAFGQLLPLHKMIKSTYGSGIFG